MEDKISIKNEKEAMRKLANELDYFLDLTIRLAGHLMVHGHAELADPIVKDGRRAYETLEAVNKFLKNMEPSDNRYSIKKSEGWIVEKNAQEAISDLQKRVKSLKETVVSQIVDPKLNLN